jgi:exodeoxyribonuclease VII small subunit
MTSTPATPGPADPAAADSTAPDLAAASASAGGLGYEAARDELAQVVARLEQGGVSLEESLRLWERGEQLADLCLAWLVDARGRVDAAVAARSEHRTNG